jgi:hypothetical protein
VKKLKRRQAIAWLRPIRDCFRSIKTEGEVETVGGYAVSRLHENDDYARTDHCIAGFRGLIGRLFPEISVEPLRRVEKKLANGVPLTVKEIDECLRTLNVCEDAITGFPVKKMKDAVMAEQISIEFEQLGIKPQEETAAP